jgi:heme A synthase
MPDKLNLNGTRNFLNGNNVNGQSMTLSEFQCIYGWEYGDRMLGRVVGLIFVLPWAYFSVRGRIPTGYQKRMVGLVAMRGTQGLVGWWIVLDVPGFVWSRPFIC